MISNFKKTLASIGAKIVLPYIILTLIVAAIGAYIVTLLVAGSSQERVENQVLVAGRAVSEQIVKNETERLRILQAIASGEGIAEALDDGDLAVLQRDVPLLAFSQRATAVSILNPQGVEVLGWRRSGDEPAGVLTENMDTSGQPDVQEVLSLVDDGFGTKRAFLAGTPPNAMIFTVGPMILGDEVVGAILVGTDLRELASSLGENTSAYVTFYDRTGQALATSFAGNPDETLVSLQGDSEQYDAVISGLQTSAEVNDLLYLNDDKTTVLSRLEVDAEEYILAFDDWRLRGQSFGLFSAALPSQFIAIEATTNRNLFTGLFVSMTLAVFIIGLLLAQRITKPIRRLVDVSTAVAKGDLEQHTNIKQKDEIGILANSFDIMTRNLAERNRELVEQKSELEAILHSITDAVMVINNDNEIVASNPAAEKLLKHITSHSDAPATYLQSSKSSIRSDLNVNTLMALETIDSAATRFRVGSRVFGISASPFKTPDGNELGRVIIMRDETRQVETEQLKDGFITSISHELRTPLTSMKGYLHLLNSKKSDNLTTQQKQFIGIIQNSTELIVNHVNKIIDITSIQEGSLRLKKNRLCLTDVVCQQTEEWRDKMESKHIIFEVVLDQDIWVMGDETRLDWAIDNILRNANYYTLEGGRVTVCLAKKDGYASLQIQDTGVGISEVDQPHIFSRFYRAQNELTLHVPGLGIELYVAKSIVEAHNGRIWVESELGKGSTFGIELLLTE